MIRAVIFDCTGVLYVPAGDRLVRDEAILEYAKDLRKQYKIALLSNLSSGGLDKYFTQAEREEYFDVVVVPGDVGLMKSQPEIYVVAAERLGVTPQEVVFIDDVAMNCTAARVAGMRAIVYENLQKLQKEVAKVR
jgi:FMN phosphatase YigB (HAD superfamily)